MYPEVSAALDSGTACTSFLHFLAWCLEQSCVCTNCALDGSFPVERADVVYKEGSVSLLAVSLWEGTFSAVSKIQLWCIKKVQLACLLFHCGKVPSVLFQRFNCGV